jgi:hypothetical protein
VRRSLKHLWRSAPGVARVVVHAGACGAKAPLDGVRTRRRGAILVLAAILACLAAGCGSAMPAASLRITYSDLMDFGPVTYALRCSPASGTAPDPKALCAAISSRPALVLSGPGQDHTCPPTPSVDVRGTYGGKPISVEFSACLAGQGDLISRWLALLPSSAALDTVRLDRGLGPLALGQSRAAVKALVGPAKHDSVGIDVYQSGVEDGFLKATPVTLRVGYDRAGRVQTLASHLIALTLDGHEIASTTQRAGRLTGLLKSWTQVRCGRDAALADHPVTDGAPTTIIQSSLDHPTVVISTVARTACAAGTGA